MAIFHHVFSRIIRGGHTCAVATAAYRSGSLLKLKTKITSSEHEEEYIFDYSTKPGIAYSEIILPEYASQEFKNRQYLWQLIEELEGERHAELACESIFALPEELSLEESINFIRDFVAISYQGEGLVVDVNIHNEHKNNPHIHIMSPMRKLQLNGEFGMKLSEEYIKVHISKIEENFKALANKHLEKCGYALMGASDLPRYEQMRPWL
jgi:ATP-dependent exoDNAse (exonuclease V) alpha subunit